MKKGVEEVFDCWSIPPVASLPSPAVALAEHTEDSTANTSKRVINFLLAKDKTRRQTLEASVKSVNDS